MIPPSPLVLAVRASVVVLVALVVQVSVVADLTVVGTRGDIMVLVAVAAGLAAGPDRGAALGFASGLAYDLLLQTPFGLSALTYALVGYLAGWTQEAVLRAAWWIPVATAAGLSAVGVILYAVVATVVGVELDGISVPRVALVVAALNAALSPLAVRAARWATGTGEGRSPRMLAR